MTKLRQSAAKYLNWVDTALGTAFEMRTSKGEVNEKNTENSLNQRGKWRVLLALSRFIYYLISFGFQSLEIRLNSVNTRIGSSSLYLTSTAYESPCASNPTSPPTMFACIKMGAPLSICIKLIYMVGPLNCMILQASPWGMLLRARRGGSVVRLATAALFSKNVPPSSHQATAFFPGINSKDMHCLCGRREIDIGSTHRN